MKVILFSYAGSLGYPYRSWVDNNTTDLELITIDYAGRGSRGEDKQVNSWENLIEDMTEQVLEIINTNSSESFFLFGHSMGAKVAYDVLRNLEKKNVQTPSVVFFSGSLPFNQTVELNLNDETLFRKKMIDLGGIPQEVLDDPELSDYIFSIMKTDALLLDEFIFESKQFFKSKIVIFEGEEDSYGEKNEWKEVLGNDFDFKLFSGGHFFIFQPEQAVLQAIKSYV